MTQSSQESKDMAELDVLIELAGSAVYKHRVDPSDPERQEFQQRLLRYLQDLVASVSLPIRFRLEIPEEKGANVPALKPVQVRVGDRMCRLPVDMKAVEDGTAVGLARFIAQAVTEDRENLISEQLVATLWPSVAMESGNATDTLDPVRLRECVHALIRRGQAFSRLPTLLERSRGTSAGGILFGSFEEALWAPDQIGLEIALGTKQVEAISSAENLKVAFGSYLVVAVPDPERILAPRLNDLRRRLFDDLGIILPKVKVRIDEKLAPNEFRFRLNDLLLPPEDGLEKFELLVEDSVDQLRLLGVNGREWLDGSTRKSIVSTEDKVRCEAVGFSTIDPTEFIVSRMERSIRHRAELFLTTYCIDNLRTSSPQLVEAACQRIGTPTLLRVLEGTLMEGLSIRDLRGICESLLAIDSVTTVDQNKFIVFFPPVTNICAVRQEKPFEALDDLDYLSCARMSMKSYFSAEHATDGTLVVYLVDPQLEQRIARADVDPLSEDERQRLLTAFEAEIGSLPMTVTRPTILTTVEARHQLWTLIEREFRRYPVLTYTELSPELNIQPIARISITEN